MSIYSNIIIDSFGRKNVESFYRKRQLLNRKSNSFNTSDEYKGVMYINEPSIVKGHMTICKNSGIISIGEKYSIKPKMTLEEIINSNLYNLIIETEEFKKNLFKKSDLQHVYLKTIQDEEYFIAINLELKKNILTNIHINTVNPKYPLQNEDFINMIHHSDDDWCNKDLPEFFNGFINNLSEEEFNLQYNTKISFITGHLDYIVKEPAFSDKKTYSLIISFID